MISFRQRFAATLLVACASFATTASAKADPVKARLLSSFEKAGLYRPPEVPEGCLKWQGTPKGDSVLYTASVSGEPACKGVGPIAQRWILPRTGEAPLLVDGRERTSLGDLTGVDLPKEEQDRLLTNQPRSKQEDKDTGKGVKLQGIRGISRGPAVRAQVAPPKPSDVEIVGESPSRTKESILRVIRQHVGGFMYSYQKVLRKSPESEGDLSFRFTIAPSGQILSMLITKSTTGDQELDFEIRNKAERMKFEAIDVGEVTVIYHLSLRRNPKDGAESPGKPSQPPFHTSTGSPTSRVDVEEGNGLRTPESILRVLHQNSGGFKLTYQKYLRNQPDLDPKFGVRLTIAPSGRVVEASEDKTTTGSVEADEELIAKFRNLKFDSIDQGQVKLVYRFELSD